MSTSPPSFYNPIPATQTREVLRETPDLSYFQHLNYSEERYRDAIRYEIKQRWIDLNNGKSPDRLTNQRGYSKIKKEVHAEYRHLHREHRARTLLWLQSERTRNILRSKGQTPAPTQDQIDQAMMRFVQHLDYSKFPEIDESVPHLGPNEFFELSRPQLVADWGYPFFSTMVEGVQHDARQEKIIGVNTDFWAALLGGDNRLGHDLVFYVPESRFYFYDVLQGCYLPTTVEKVCLVASHALQQRAWGQESSEGMMILEKFRTKKVMDEIMAKAKAILAADAGFFIGQDARPRWKDTRHEVQVESTIAIFVKEHVEPAEGQILTVGECLLQLGKKAEIPLSRKVKTNKINEVIRDLFHKGLRNDLRLDDNRQVSGWRGLKLRGVDTLLDDGAIRDTDASGKSDQTTEQDVAQSPAQETVLLN